MKKIFVNLKDWKNLEEHKLFSKQLREKIVLFVGEPYLYLYSNNENIELGVQDISFYKNRGEITGNTSIDNIKEFNVKWVLLNHNENLIKSKEIFKNKVKSALNSDINILICINSAKYFELNRICNIIKPFNNLNNIYFAYEPLKNKKIGTIHKNISYIKNFFRKKLDHEFPILYGTNVTKENAEEYISDSSIDGILISRGALDIKNLEILVNIVK